MRRITAAASAAVTAMSAGAAVLAAGRYVSGLALAAPGTAPAGSERLTVHGADADRVTISRTTTSDRPGRYALTSEDCHAVVGDAVLVAPDSVTRRLERVDRGALSPGDSVDFGPQVWSGDPRTALGTDFEDVTVAGELGAMPAWFIPGVRDTWVITAHGLGATREQCLAAVPLLTGFGLPVLDITYRNDRGAPRSSDRISHLGAAEWRDLDAALRFAVHEGARAFVLYGWSVGATMALRAAHRSTMRGRIRGLVLDSPVLDWKATVRARARKHGVPPVLLPLGVRAAEGRTGLHGGALDRSAHPDTLSVPTFLAHGPGDTIAPWDKSRALAERRSDLVVLHTVPHAEHAAVRNADEERYDEALRRFLTPLL